MIYRMAVLEADGTEEALDLDLRTMRGSEITASEHLGGVRLEEDGWHVLGASGISSPNAYPAAENALQILIVANARNIARRLAP